MQNQADETCRKREIDSIVLRLKLQSKETRKKHVKRFLAIVLTSILLVIGTYLVSLSPYIIAPYNLLAVFTLADILMFALGGFLLLGSLSKIFRPLSSTYSAIKNILEAVQTIETSDEQIAYEDAYGNLKKALKSLNRLINNYLVENDWYNKLNTCITDFVDELEFTLMPATFDRTIEKSDLVNYAFALYSLDKDDLLKVKEALDNKVVAGTYKKS